jgi:hypothetical protein
MGFAIGAGRHDGFEDEIADADRAGGDVDVLTRTGGEIDNGVEQEIDTAEEVPCGTAAITASTHDQSSSPEAADGAIKLG